MPAARLPPWLATRTAWTPTREQAARAEASLRAHLEWGVQNQERFEPREEEYVRGFLPDVVKALPAFVRYYTGRIENGAREILVIGVHESYTRRRSVDLWQWHIPGVVDGACSYWWFSMDAATERPLRFRCNGNP